MMRSKFSKGRRPITLADYLPGFPLPPAPNPIPASTAPVTASSISSPSTPPFPGPSSSSSIKQGVFYKVPPVKKVLTPKQCDYSRDIPSDDYWDLPPLEGYVPAVAMPVFEKPRFALQVESHFCF